MVLETDCDDLVDLLGSAFRQAHAHDAREGRWRFPLRLDGVQKQSRNSVNASQPASVRQH